MVRDGVRVCCVQLEARDVEDADRALDEAVAAAGEAARESDLVVLPEATYPGYVLHDEKSFLDPKWWLRGVEAFADVARAGKAYVVVGLVRPAEDRIFNSAAVFSPRGDVVAVVDKSFLWHFDARWFAPGAPGDVLRLPFGDAGVFVCADARMMEIPRRLAVEGARLLCDPTALVLSASGTNAQIDYMLAARAWENGCFLAVANKCGREAGVAHYAGRSAILGPDGARLAEAGPARPEVITADVDLRRAPGPRGERRVDAYACITAHRSPGVVEALRRPPPARPLRIALLQTASRHARLVDELGADFALVHGDVASERVLAAAGGRFRHGASVHEGGKTLEIGGALVGLLSGDWLSVPEEARRLALEGASVLVWGRPDGGATPLEVLRTRADENRVFLIAISPAGDWIVIAPSGAILARGGAFDGREAVLVELHLALAWSKEMAPGTDVVAHRRPEDYEALTRGG